MATKVLPLMVARSKDQGAEFFSCGGPQGLKPFPDMPIDSSRKQYTNLMELNGTYAAFLRGVDTVDVVHTGTWQVVYSIVRSGERIRAVSFSPKGTFIVTWESPSNTNRDIGNLRVWRTSNGAMVAIFKYRLLIKESWPYLRWNDDEAVLGRMTPEGLEFYPGHLPNPEKCEAALTLPGLNCFSFSPTGTQIAARSRIRIAVFQPEMNGQMGTVAMFMYTNLKKAVTKRKIAAAEDCEFKWDSKGSAVLARVTAVSDATNQSYDGVSSLHMMRADSTYMRVPLEKEGPIADFCWIPGSHQFLACYGTVPQQTAVYGINGDLAKVLSNDHRNEVHVCPLGRFACVAGFGHLTGKMDFWDLEQMKYIGTGQSRDTTSAKWSLDGRRFITATCTPRLRVSNVLRVFTYSGERVSETKYNELYEFAFLPAPPGVWKSRPPSPGFQYPSEAPCLTSKKESSLSAIAEGKGFKRSKGGYVPPHLRGNGTPAFTMTTAAQATPASKDKKSLSPEAKKLKKLMRKRTSIRKIQNKVDSGSEVDVAQLEKLAGLPELEDEIKELTLAINAIEAAAKEEEGATA